MASKYQSGSSTLTRHSHASHTQHTSHNITSSTGSNVGQPKRRRPQLYYLFLVVLVVFVTFVIFIFTRHTHITSAYFHGPGKTFSNYVPLPSTVNGDTEEVSINPQVVIKTAPSKKPTPKLRIPASKKPTRKPTSSVKKTARPTSSSTTTSKKIDTTNEEEKHPAKKKDQQGDDEEEEEEVAYSEVEEDSSGSNGDDVDSEETSYSNQEVEEEPEEDQENEADEEEQEQSYSAAVAEEAEESPAEEEVEQQGKEAMGEEETEVIEAKDNVESVAVHQLPDEEEGEVAYTDMHEDSSLTKSKSEVSSLSNVWDEQQRMLSQVRKKLADHPIHAFYQAHQSEHSIEDVLFYMHAQSQCHNIPIFTSMANVFSELYWQMIENFIYTMVKFDLSDCAVMICVSDKLCMQRCRESSFPCVDFQYRDFHPERTDKPSALEQIAELKLLHIPKALKRGVDVIMIDLDVGFLTSPMQMVKKIEPDVDIYVQKDITYVMNRTTAGWRTWYTEPLPNIGVFYVRGNDKTVSMFRDAWADYQTMNPKMKTQPGKDQNKVAAALRASRFLYQLKWKHFPAENIVLLDMVYKYSDPRFELGGRAASAILDPKTASTMMKDPALLQHQYHHVRKMIGKRTQDVGHVMKDSVVEVVHTTCYEQKVKVNGLKAANAYWNPFYYDASRRTITKPLIFITMEQLAHEVRSLLYLAYASNRSLIIPNVLGHEVPHERFIEYFEDRTLWPWFRIPFYMKNYAYHHIKVIEPSYYWRIARDYFTTDSQRRYIPSPVLVNITSKVKSKSRMKAISIRDIEQVLLSEKYHEQSRLVINLQDDLVWSAEQLKERSAHLHDWAMDSIGQYDDYQTEAKYYEALPRLNQEKYSTLKFVDIAPHLMQQVRLCKNTFEFDRGNRSCFDKCD